MKTKMIWMIAMSFLFLCGFSGETEYLINAVCENEDPKSYELPMIQAGMDPSSISLPSTFECVIEGNEMWDTYSCPVVWENLSLVDTSVSGRITIKGKLNPEEGYLLSKDVNPEVTYSVMILSEGMEKETLKEMECIGGNNLLAVGGNLADLNFETREAVCYTSNYGEFFTCPVDWNMGTVDVQKAGTYEVTGSPKLPDGFALPEGSEYVTARIGVVEADKIDLSAVMTANRDQLICEWLMEIDPADVELGYSPDCETWSLDPCWENGAGYYGFVWERMMVIQTIDLEEDRDYYFRLSRNGEYSQVLYIRKTADDLIVKSGVEEENAVIEESADANPCRDNNQEKIEMPAAAENQIHSASIPKAYLQRGEKVETVVKTTDTPEPESKPESERTPEAAVSEVKKEPGVTEREAGKEDKKTDKKEDQEESDAANIPIAGKMPKLLWIVMILTAVVFTIVILGKIIREYLIFNQGWTIINYKNRNV